MDGISAIDFLSTTSLNKLINCKYLNDLNTNCKSGEVINASFRIFSSGNNIQDYNCGINAELPEIISHHLHLNLSFVTSDSFKDGNITQIFVSNDADYIINGISMTKLSPDHNSIATPNYIKENYYFSFIMKKKSIRISLNNYYSILNISIWMLLFATIVVVGVIQGIKLILRKKENIKNIFKFTLNLIFNYFNLMMFDQSSVLLHKIVPRNYLMYFIPLLSIIVVHLMKESIYSNMISLPKHWCETLECFTQSNIRFVTLDPSLHNNFLTIKKEHQFKLIASRMTWHPANSKFKKIIKFLNYNFNYLF